MGVWYQTSNPDANLVTLECDACGEDPRWGPIRKMNPVNEGKAMPGREAVTQRNALDMQVCVPEYWTDEMVVSFANEENPCGPEGGWSIVRTGSRFLAGDPERQPCTAQARFVHIMLEC